MAKEKKTPQGAKKDSNQSHFQERDMSVFSIDKIRSGITGSLMTKIIMGLLIVVFAVGFLFMDPGILGGLGGGGGNAPGKVNLNEIVASIGDQDIPRGNFLQALQNQEQMMAQYGVAIGPSDRLAAEYQTLQSLGGQLAMIIAAQGEGITISNQEIDDKIQSEIDNQIKQQSAQNPAGFRRQVEARFGSEQGYRDELTKQMQANRKDVENALMVEKLQKKIEASVGASSEDKFKRSHTKLKVRQLVIDVPPVAPASKDPKKAQDEAIATAKAKMDKLVAQAKAKPTSDDFIKLVKQNSDDAQSKTNGGDLGWHIPQELPIDYPMRQALADSNGNIVGPLQDSTTKAFFLFYIEGRKLELPADYAKKKDQYLKDDKAARANQAWSAYQQKITQTAKDQLEIKDPALQAFAIENEKVPSATGAAADDLRKQAVDLYQQALKNTVGDDATAIRLQLATLYTGLKQPQKAEEVLAVAAKESPQSPQVLTSYATALRENKKNDEALKEVKMASQLLDDRPSTPNPFGGNPDDAMRFQIASEFDALGKKDLADAERKKVKPQQSSNILGQ